MKDFKISVLFISLFITPVSEIFGQKASKVNKAKIEIQTEITRSTGDFAVAFKNLSTNKTIFINEKTSFHAASTMKTPVMIEVFKQAEIGLLKLTDSILVINKFKSIVDGSSYKMELGDDSDDTVYKNLGLKMSIYDLVFQMITVSSNLATNLLIELVGAKKANQTMRDLGAKDIQVLRGVEDNKAFAAGLNNTTTAYDLLLIFEKLAKNQILSKENHSKMIEILKSQRFNEIIPAKLPKGTMVAHKTGSITGVQHDSGIIYLPNGEKYVLVLLSKNLKSAKEGVKLLSKISEIIYQMY